MSEYVRGRYQLVPRIFVLLSASRTCDGFYFVETNAQLAHRGVHPSDRTPVLNSLKQSTALLFQKKLAEFPATLRVEPHHTVLMPPPRALLIMVMLHPASGKLFQLLHQEPRKLLGTKTQLRGCSYLVLQTPVPSRLFWGSDLVPLNALRAMPTSFSGCSYLVLNNLL